MPRSKAKSTRSRTRLGFFIALLSALTLLQGATPLENPRVRKLGEQLACLCGCGSTITSCNMLHCHFAEPAREKLLAMVQAGQPDEAIIAAFVKEHGRRIILKPPAEGFNLVGWLMPFIGLSAGTAFVWWLLQRLRQKPTPAAGPALDAAVLSRYQQRIDKDLENLD